MLTAPQARADDWNKQTKVTFSAPVEIPGKHLKGFGVLPAGTYIFKLVDSQSDRHIVQIFNERQDKCYATILAVPNARVQPTDKTVITFSERPNGEPPAIRAWFYPGDRYGQEFVYPKQRAKEIAQATQTPVLYNNAPAPPEATEPIAPPTQAEVQEMNQSEIGAYNPQGEEVELSQAVTPPPPANMQTTPAPAPAAQPAASALPQTASPLGWIMLSGLLALAGALGIRFARQVS
jgi:hypothetical protein